MLFSSVLWWLEDIFLMHLPSFDKFNYQIYSLISLKIQYPTKILMWICKTHRHKYIWSDLVIFNVIEILATPDFISTNFSCVDIPNLCSCTHGGSAFSWVLQGWHEGPFPCAYASGGEQLPFIPELPSGAMDRASPCQLLLSPIFRWASFHLSEEAS